MSTRDTIQKYVASVKAKHGWESSLADDMRFTILSSPPESVTERSAYHERLSRFYSMMQGLEIRKIIVDGEDACVLARYELQTPGGERFESHVAEVFKVRDGKIETFDIYFDSAPFSR